MDASEYVRSLLDCSRFNRNYLTAPSSRLLRVFGISIRIPDVYNELINLSKNQLIDNRIKIYDETQCRLARFQYGMKTVFDYEVGLEYPGQLKGQLKKKFNGLGLNEVALSLYEIALILGIDYKKFDLFPINWSLIEKISRLADENSSILSKIEYLEFKDIKSGNFAQVSGKYL